MESTNGLVLRLGEAAGAPPALVGGKAAGFGPLAAAGLSFPPGVVVTADAHRRARSDGWRPGAPLPADVEAALRAATADLPDSPVAVRSSAVAEDGGDASFAGQFDTLLAVPPAGAGDAVARCWTSAEVGRAHAYRLGNGAEHTMAVIVQSLVDAESSGVVVTADPLTGAPETLVVNASFGLGEAVVSGLVTPDEYRLARADGAIVGAVIADKDICLVRGPDGPREVSVPSERRRTPALTAGQLRDVWAGALAAEQVLGRPADLEFAVHAGRLHWLQCRPLTALPDRTDKEAE